MMSPIRPNFMSAASAASSSNRRLSASTFLLLIVAATISSPIGAARPGHAATHVDPVVQLAHTRMDPSQSVTMLGRHSFNTTVKQENVDNWIVLFCVDWLDHCQGLWHDYRRMAMRWEHSLASNASSWHNTAVRFAEVDCAADKPLCNENHVEMYPSVVHFKKGKLIKAWDVSKGAKSLSGDISLWISKELTPKVMRNELAKHTGMSGSRLLRDFWRLLSWKDPSTAAIGYFVLAIAVVVFAWVVSTGLELELKATLGSFATEVKKPWTSAFLPELKDMAAPRTLVRTTMEL
jgi:hypothetical protein